MATRKTVGRAKKTVAKKTAKASIKKTKGVKKGTKYACEVCGLVVSVDRACGCAVCDLLCCGKPMKTKK